MRWLLAAGLILGACSGNTDGGGGATVPPPEGGASSGGKMTLSQAGSSVSGGGAAPASGGTAAGANASSAGSEPTSGGAQGGGAQAGGESGGSGSTSGTGGSGGTATAGTANDGGAPMASGGAGETQSGGEGGAAPNTPDPCEGVKHWSPTEKWTDYTPRPPDAPANWQGDLRVFGGILWAAQAVQGCQTYPGHGGFEGWIQIATCAGGPVAETAPCQCAAGACCDGCYLRGASYFCGETVRAGRCDGQAATQCVGATTDITSSYSNLFCDGLSAGDCTRWGPHTKDVGSRCEDGTVCVESGDQAACVACPN